MIKLQDILREIIKPPIPSKIYRNNGEENINLNKDNENNNGFKLKNTTINPHTGTSTSEVEYTTYELTDIRKHLNAYNRSIKPLRYSQNADIASLSIDIIRTMKNLSDKVKSLEKLIDIYKK